ncbi:hypothetical protein CERSUDRAFT_99696 [Gelatoporia subvermispora B]|uniref:Ribonuclease H1 N-terminal domain-containing protein n=1 Tax=Ceriporiopsis subvermispora (strain B) TaxID=914234 RepID=M2QJL5_CERS8|nr:hypothetical protein CERSUDRAFT_99696 [Gelatoporia subvermispora B]
MSKSTGNAKSEGANQDAPSHFTMQALLDALLQALAERQQQSQQVQSDQEPQCAARDNGCQRNEGAAGRCNGGLLGSSIFGGNPVTSIRIDIEAPRKSRICVASAAPYHLVGTPERYDTASATAVAGGDEGPCSCDGRSRASSLTQPASDVGEERFEPEDEHVAAAGPSQLPPPGQCWYSVTRGLSVGVFNDWGAVQPLVSGVANACFRHFPTRQGALAAFNVALERGHIQVLGEDHTGENGHGGQSAGAGDA